MASKKKKKNKFKFNNRRTLVLAILISMFSYIDLWGLNEVLENSSHKLFYSSIAPWFTKHQNKNITVVLITDDDLEHYGETWPVSYDFHADLLKKILSYQPESIFVDFIFNDEKPGNKELIEALNKNEKTELYFGAGTPPPSSFLNKIVNQSSKIELVNLHIKSRDAIIYPISTIQSKEELKFHKTIYLSLPQKKLCSKKFPSLKHKKEILEEACIKDTYKYSDTSNFYITWNNLCYDKLGYIAEESECDSLPTNPIIRFVRLLYNNIFNVSSDHLQPANKKLYFPHQTISASHIFNEENKEHKEHNHKLINKNYIFYGSYIKDTNDFITPPNHNVLPGVYIHAMAYENLLNYGTEMITEGAKISVLIITFLTSFILILYNDFFSFKLEKYNKRYKKQFRKNKFKYLAKSVTIMSTYVFSVILIIILMTMLLPFYAFSMAPLSGFTFASLLIIFNLPIVCLWIDKIIKKLGLERC